jgi:predicted AlkP superfamily pyrophosphatase or phosphodiesterase
MRKLHVVLILVCIVGCASPRNTVVWISIDGFRFDYPDKSETPLLHRMMRQGAYSRDLVTITPSLTFPSHVSEATGVAAGEHGIVSNEFYDTATKQRYSFPNDASLLQAEPIWITAQRQGVRTLVYDWPLSYGTWHGARCAYARDAFDAKPTDEQRLDEIISTWQSDRNAKPLRLLMGYIKKPDALGHRFGPESPQVAQAIAETDALLDRFVERAVEHFRQTAKHRDELYVIITTDHGMMHIHTLVNVDKLFTTPPPKETRITTSGPLAFIYLDQLPPPQHAQVIATMLDELKRYNFIAAYTRQSMPKEWHLDHPTRSGDIVLMLQPGYSFNRSKPLTTYPVSGADSRATHGFPVSGCPEMRGFAAIWRYPTPLGGRDLGEVRVEQLHPTVARILDVDPARSARAQPLTLGK